MLLKLRRAGFVLIVYPQLSLYFIIPLSGVLSAMPSAGNPTGRLAGTAGCKISPKYGFYMFRIFYCFVPVNYNLIYLGYHTIKNTRPQIYSARWYFVDSCVHLERFILRRLFRTEFTGNGNHYKTTTKFISSDIDSNGLG